MVLFLLVLLHIYVWHRRIEQRNYLITLTFVIFSFSVLFIMLLQIDVANLNLNGTYGTDETYYYNNMVLIKNNLAYWKDFLAPYYNFVGGYALKTTGIESVVVIRILNVMIYSLSMNFLYLLIFERVQKLINEQKYEVNIKRLQMMFMLMSINGIVIWTTIRVLKDIMYVALIIIFLYIFEHLRSKKRFSFESLKQLIAFGLGVHIFNNLRPMGGVTMAAIFAAINFRRSMSNDMEIFTRKNIVFKIKKTTRYVIIASGMALVLANIISTKLLFAFRDLIYSPMQSVSVSRQIIIIPLEFIRFILGPGPYNSLRQLITGEVFMVSTLIGDILIFLGAIQWWAILLLTGVIFVNKPKKTKVVAKYFFDFLLLTIFIVSTYTFVYGGTGDTRLRAIMYVLSFGFFTPLFALKYKKNYKLDSSYKKTEGVK